MTDRKTLAALIERVEQATERDKEADSQITQLLLPRDADLVTRSSYGWSYRVFGPDGWEDVWLEIQPYTGSTDVAATLVPKGLIYLVGIETIHQVFKWTTWLGGIESLLPRVPVEESAHYSLGLVHVRAPRFRASVSVGRIER